MTELRAAMTGYGKVFDVIADGRLVGLVQPSRSDGTWSALPEDGIARHRFATADEAAAYVVEENAHAKAEAATFKARRNAILAAEGR